MELSKERENLLTLEIGPAESNFICYSTLSTRQFTVPWVLWRQNKNSKTIKYNIRDTRYILYVISKIIDKIIDNNEDNVTIQTKKYVCFFIHWNSFKSLELQVIFWLEMRVRHQLALLKPRVKGYQHVTFMQLKVYFFSPFGDLFHIAEDLLCLLCKGLSSFFFESCCSRWVFLSSSWWQMCQLRGF